MSSAVLAASSPVQSETRSLSPAGNTARQQSQAEIIQQQISQNDIAQLAYALWQRRGCPDGSAEVDWLEAEAQLLKS